MSKLWRVLKTKVIPHDSDIYQSSNYSWEQGKTSFHVSRLLSRFVAPTLEPQIQQSKMLPLCYIVENKVFTPFGEGLKMGTLF